MTQQPHLFDRCLTIRTRKQPDLFDGRPVVAHGVTCNECGAELIETDSYLCCPNGCGRLIPDVPTDDPDEC